MASGTPLGNMVIQLGLDATKLSDSLTKTKNQLRNFEKEIKSQNSLASFYKNGADAAKVYEAQKNTLNKAIQTQSNLLQKLKKDYDVEVAANGEMSKKAQRLAGEIETGNGKLAQYAGQLKKVAEESYLASSKLNAFGDKITTFGSKAQKVGGALDTVSKSTKGMSLAIFGGMAVSAKAAIDFETAFAGVKKTVDEVPATNGRAAISYKDLEAGIRNMSKELPASAAEIAKVVEISGQLGIQTEDVLAFSKVMIDMGESTNMSAEAAATSLAKFANITKMSSSDYQRLGSAIVELGNNYATTEQDITEMSLRLAGAGTQAGLSQADIIGLATALSSVGIEAEMGGSAFSKLMVNMQVAASSGAERMADLSAKTGMSRRELELMSSNSTRDFKALADSIGMTTDEMDNIIKSSKNLENFASIAGMTASQFKQSFEKDAVGTIAKFVEGLGNAEKQGKTSIEVLNDMGISEVRLRDTLLRAGNASDIFTQAVKDSNKAWGDNRALTDEANKRYATTESKLKIVRNKLNDVAITLGGPLLDAFSSALDASKPLINDVADLAEGFSKLDKGTQQSIIYMALFMGAVSPVSKILGSTISTVGSLSNHVGTFAKWMAKIGAEKAGIEAVSTLGVEAAGASGNVGVLGSSISSVTGSLISPAGLVIAVALATTGIVALANAKDKAREKAEEFGTVLNEKTKAELEQFKGKVDETSVALIEFDTKGSSAIDNVKNSFSALLSEIENSKTSADKRLDELAKKLGLSDEQVKRGKEHNNQIVENARIMTEEIKAIYERHNNDTSKLTAEERAIVENNQRELVNAKLSLMNLSNKEEKAIRQAFNSDITQLNETQLKKNMSTLEKAMRAENKAYKKNLDDLREAYEMGAYTQNEYNTKKEEAEAQHQEFMRSLQEKYQASAEAADAKARARLRDWTTNNQINAEKAKTFLKDLGLSWEELSQKVDTAAKNGGHSVDFLAKSTSNMSKETKDANALWTSLTFDEKKMEVKSNAVEEVIKASQSEEGWNQLMFMMKYANLTSNARIAVAEALVANGDWDKMTPEEKNLVVNNKEGLAAIFESESLLNIWNSLPTEVKKFLGENVDFISKESTARSVLENWDSLTLKEKELYAKNLTENGVVAAKETLDKLEGKEVTISATDLTLSMVNQANESVNSVKQIGPTPINASDNTGGQVASANNSVNSPKQNSPIKMHAMDSTGPAVGQTNRSVNSPKQNSPIRMFAMDSTAQPVNSANNAVNSVRQRRAIGINATNNVGDVVSSVWSSLNLLPVTKYINIVAKKVGLEKGTNFHEGGLAMVNDQKGSLYKELVTLPSGESFIPQGRNVVLPLPRGSKVLTASRTKALMHGLNIPRYESGIGFPKDAKIFKDIEAAERGMAASQNVNVSIDNHEVIELLKKILDALPESQRQTLDLTVKIGNRTFSELVEDITAEQTKNVRRRNSSVLV